LCKALILIKKIQSQRTTAVAPLIETSVFYVLYNGISTTVNLPKLPSQREGKAIPKVNIFDQGCYSDVSGMAPSPSQLFAASSLPMNYWAPADQTQNRERDKLDQSQASVTGLLITLFGAIDVSLESEADSSANGVVMPCEKQWRYILFIL